MPSFLQLQVIGDQDQGVVDSFEFYPGEVRSLKLQVIDGENLQKVVIPAAATKTLTLSATPADLVVVNADITVDTSDASIFSVSISATMSAAMITGIIQFQWVVSSPASTRIALAEYGLKRLSTIAD